MSKTIQNIDLVKSLLEDACMESEEGYLIYSPETIGECVDALTDVLDSLGVDTSNYTLH